MRREALPFLACPVTSEPLELARVDLEDPDGHVMEGELSARGGARYPIREGVPRLLPPDVEAIKVETAERFAEEWHRWAELRDYYEQQFLGWVAPVTRADFEGKVVFEGGCGKGRHTSVVAGFGAEAVVAIDLGSSALVAFRNTRHLKNAHVVIGDLMRPPVQKAFDLAFSVGVLHHLPDPGAAFQSLASVLKKGGKVVAWVYGYENNEWITRFVDPVRKALTASLGARALRVLSMAPSAVLWGAIKLLYKPDAQGHGPKLPYGDYFASMHDFPFDELHSIVFDQLVTPVAFYLKEDEVRRWVAEGFADPQVRWHRRYSWTVTGTKA